MLAETVTHIPTPDMLGLPMPAWLGQCLMALTLAVHWAFLAIWRQATASGKNATNATKATSGKDVTSIKNAGDPRVSSIRRPAVAGLLGLVAMLGAAVWVAWAQPVEMLRALLAGPEYAFLAYVVISAIAVAIVLSILAVRRPSLSRLVSAAGATFIALLAIAAVRDTIRRAALSPAFDLSAVPVHAQWDSFALWAVVFIAGLALAAYMIALTGRTRPAGQ